MEYMQQKQYRIGKTTSPVALYLLKGEKCANFPFSIDTEDPQAKRY